MEGLTSLQETLATSSRTVFNCFYAVKDPAGFVGDIDPFAPSTIAWNILYSLGYLYNDFKAIDTELKATTTNSATLGKKVGDAIMRPFYSRYLERF